MFAKSMIFLKFYLCIIFFMSFEERCSAKFNETIIGVPQGFILGRVVTTLSGFKYKSFQGIPYAQPPLGNLRFRDPQPLSSWNGILWATHLGNSCTQITSFIKNVAYGTEDCLYLNVYVPNDARNVSLPVMVWIHGGGFMEGDGTPDIYGPDYLIENGVILVTFNYRLGAMGFLSLNTPDVPGNAALKDQATALKWVKENIKYFGGNANKITLFGESSGSASVEYQMLSPLSKGLFNRAIMQSGTSTCPWALQDNPEKMAFALSEILGFKSENKTAVVQYLRKVPENDIVKASRALNLIGSIYISFAPVLETVFPNTKAFITKPPLEILKSKNYNRVPTITGLTTFEGLIFTTSEVESAADQVAIANNIVPDLKRFIPKKITAKYNQNETDQVEAKIRKTYFQTTDDIYDKYVSLISDFTFVKDAIVSLKLHATNAPPAFFYKFSYSGSKNLLRLATGMKYNGSAHSDELTYMFRSRFLDGIPTTQADDLLTRRLTKLWTNFAKYGNPTPEFADRNLLPVAWPPVDVNDIKLLDIDNNLSVITNPFLKTHGFWEEISQM